MYYVAYSPVSPTPQSSATGTVNDSTYNGLFFPSRLRIADNDSSCTADLPNMSLMYEADFSGTLSDWRCERAPFAPHSPPALLPNLELDRILAYAG